MIIHEICTNSLGAFSGFGRHLANDFLFTMALFPGTPSYEICSDDEHFAEFEAQIYNYLSQFSTKKFFDRVTSFSVASANNPFAFQERANQKYMKHYILVFRRERAMVSIDLYDKYLKLGLLDENHIIG